MGMTVYIIKRGTTFDTLDHKDNGVLYFCGRSMIEDDFKTQAAKFVREKQGQYRLMLLEGDAAAQAEQCTRALGNLGFVGESVRNLNQDQISNSFMDLHAALVRSLEKAKACATEILGQSGSTPSPLSLKAGMGGEGGTSDRLPHTIQAAE